MIFNSRFSFRFNYCFGIFSAWLCIGTEYSQLITIAVMAAVFIITDIILEYIKKYN